MTDTSQKAKQSIADMHMESVLPYWDALGVQDLKRSFSWTPHIESKSKREKKAALFYHSKKSSFLSGTLLDFDFPNEKINWISTYPVMQGLLNEVVIQRNYTWQNGLLGEVFARVKDNFLISFFDPFYCQNQTRYSQNEAMQIELSALALVCSPANPLVFNIERGYFLLKKYKELEAQKTGGAISFPGISFSKLCRLIPYKYATWFIYQSPVEAVEKRLFEGKQIYKLTVRLGPEDAISKGQDLLTHLYVPKMILNNYEPKVGDDIQGILWLTGTLKDSHEIMQKTRRQLKPFLKESV